MNHITLNNGVKMPLLGFGTFQITDQEVCKTSVCKALQAGYRMIDTAACYGGGRSCQRKRNQQKGFISCIKGMDTRCRI